MKSKLYQAVLSAMIILLVVLMILTKMKGSDIVEEFTNEIVERTVYLQ